MGVTSVFRTTQDIASPASTLIALCMGGSLDGRTPLLHCVRVEALMEDHPYYIVYGWKIK